MDIGQLTQFFNELRPRLQMAREVDALLNQKMALRFNAFDYLRTSELGLSRVIADLLNPRASHGQGALFLRILLRGLKRSSERGGRVLGVVQGLDTRCSLLEQVSVVREMQIDDGRLDISVVFNDATGQERFLAIESKPYSPDSEGQVEKYLKFLNSRYGTDSSGDAKHSLILSPCIGIGLCLYIVDD